MTIPTPCLVDSCCREPKVRSVSQLWQAQTQKNEQQTVCEKAPILMGQLQYEQCNCLSLIEVLLLLGFVLRSRQVLHGRCCRVSRHI